MSYCQYDHEIDDSMEGLPVPSEDSHHVSTRREEEWYGEYESDESIC
jgi:hypothetical protein